MDAFIGMVSIFGFGYAPRNWAFCAGQMEQIAQNQALYSLLGSAYGGDDRTVYGIPDLRARVPVGSNDMGNPPGLTPIFRGQRSGNQTHTLDLDSLPRHSHVATFTPSGGGGGAVQVSIDVSTTDGDVSNATSGALLSQGKAGLNAAKIFQTSGSTSTVPLGGVSVSGGGGSGGTIDVNDTGDGSSFNILNPCLGMNYCMAMDGNYPPRN